MINRMVQHSTPHGDSRCNYRAMDDDSLSYWQKSSESSLTATTQKQSLLELANIKLEPDDDCHIVEHLSLDGFSQKSNSPLALSSSPSGQTTTEGIDMTARQKRGDGVAGKSIEEELCLICGDRASGYHYNALSCEGCKGFFRRSVTRGASYACKYGGNCEMDMWMRRRCQSCRLRRCREVGMKEECLLSDDQCKARDVRRKARQRMSKTQQSSDNIVDLYQPSPDSNTTSGDDCVSKADSIEHSQTSMTDSVSNPLHYVTDHHRELIESIVYYQDKYELPTEDDLQKISRVQVSDSGCPKDMSSAVYKMVAEMTILTTQLVVEFAKHLPGFSAISRDDQIVLLKGSASEVMVLRTARRYDINLNAVIFGNGIPMTKNDMKMIGLEEYIDNMFVFCHGMATLAVDNAEYAMMTAMCLLTERPGLTNPQEIEDLHDTYLHCLIEYIKYRRSSNSPYLAKLLMKFTELRTVSKIHSDSLYNLKLERGSLPPLLTEYFDIEES